MAFVFWLQTLQMKDFSKIYQIKGLKLKNKGHTNFYESCDLTKKVYLMVADDAEKLDHLIRLSMGLFKIIAHSF